MAGVSVSTVSRVLNTPDHRCATPEVRDRIWQAAMELSYVPNEAARSLRRKKGTEKKDLSLHVLMTRTDEVSQDPFFHELLHIVETEIYARGAVLSHLFYVPFFSDEARMDRVGQEQILGEMEKDDVPQGDGLIIIGKCAKAVLDVLKEKYSAIVALNRNSTHYEVDEVLCDGKKVATLATEYLISLGHKQIAYVGACAHESRYRGFVDTLLKHDLELNPGFLIDTDQTERSGADAMERLIAMRARPSAIYCANDITAVGMLKHLGEVREKEYRPSIIASDDIEEAQTTQPMLTTVQLPKQEMGRFAVMILLDRIRGGHDSTVRMEVEGKLLIRESCKKING